MNQATNDRKLRHIRHILKDPATDRRRFYFDEIHLIHRALPECDLKKVSPTITFMGKSLSFPLLISSMTGGDHALVCKINANLARAAQACGVAMAVGSQRVMFGNRKARRSFELRRFAPDTLLFANLGAVQLNYGFSLPECKEAVSVLEADALYLHLNPLQEAIQPEGNTDFGRLAEKIGNVARNLEKPVIVKEVGAGVSPQDVELLIEQNIRFVDVAGAGGTSWSRIEHYDLHQRTGVDLGLIFQDWGIPTPEALRALAPYRDRITLIASGGIRTGIDMVKAMILGAKLCGIAAPFLEPAMESAQAVICAVNQLRKEFVTAMFLLGVTHVENLIGNESLIRKFNTEPIARKDH